MVEEFIDLTHTLIYTFMSFPQSGPSEYMSMRTKIEPVEAICPRGHMTKIFYLNQEPIPKCDKCGREMVIREILVEGKHD